MHGEAENYGPFRISFASITLEPTPVVIIGNTVCQFELMKCYRGNHIPEMESFPLPTDSSHPHSNST